MAVRPPIRLPRQWPRHVKSGILHTISLASVVVTVARGRAVGRKRFHAQLDQATAEIALLREELLIKDGRWARRQRFEPRPKWPHDPRRRKVKDETLRLAVNYIENRRHLPVIELRRAA